MTFKEQIELYLAPLPSEWRDKLTKLLCEINSSQQTVSCQQVKDCETVTSLSNFNVEDSTISIQYKDEKQVTFNRSFDMEQVLNSKLEDLDPSCLTDATTWSNLTFTERLQLLIDAACSCGAPVQIAYDSSTADECAPFTEPITFVLIGQEGQGAYAFNITLNSTTATLQLPSGLTGTFTVLINAQGSDYFVFDIKDSSNITLLTGATDGSGMYGYPFTPSGTFQIEDMDHIIFTCQNSG